VGFDKEPVKAVVLSDTHIPHRAREIPKKVWELVEEADVVLHAGDFTEEWVYEDLRSRASLVAVHGNMDSSALKAKLPRVAEADVLGHAVAVAHRIQAIPKRGEHSLVITGHTHLPYIKVKAGTVYVNPGSPTVPIPPLLSKPTVAVLTIWSDRVEASLVRVA